MYEERIQKSRFGKFKDRDTDYPGRNGSASVSFFVSFGSIQRGGLGVIAAVGLGEESGDEKCDYKTRSRTALIDIIRETRNMTKNPFGVNIMYAITNYDDLVDATQAESVDVIISGAGLPLKLPSLIKNNKTKLVPIVSSARAAHIICTAWLRIPIIAAGGIFDGKDIAGRVISNEVRKQYVSYQKDNFRKAVDC